MVLQTALTQCNCSVDEDDLGAILMTSQSLTPVEMVNDPKQPQLQKARK